MKEITPMKRYKTSLDNFRSNLYPLTNEISLNKSEPKSIPWVFSRGDKTSTKGVENDFVLIFQDKKNEDLSIAFTFTYIDKSVNEQTVAGSFKYGRNDGEIKMGTEMSLEEFKSSINAFNKKIPTIKNLTFEKIVDEFNNQFVKQEFNFSKELAQADTEIAKFIKNKTKEIQLDKINDLVKESRTIREEAEAKITKKIKSSPEYKEREQLLAKLNKLNQALETKRILFEKEELLGDKKKAEQDAIKLQSENKNRLDFEVITELAKYPTAVKNRVKRNL